MDIIFLNLIFIVYLIFWHILDRIRKVYRFLVGGSQITHGKVRISRIIFRHKREDEEISRPEDFITVHESYESSDVLKDEHWFVYVLDKDYAYFVLLPKEIAHYNIINYPFMFTPVFEQAIKVAEMPLDDFIEWSKEIENKKEPPNTVLFTNTARCASTLFGSMLQHEGKSVVFAEPHVLAQLSGGQSEGLWNDEELEKLVPASIRAIRKNIPSDQICVIKTTSSEIKLVPFTKLMRNVKHIFMFRRNAVDSVEKSTYRTLGKYTYKLITIYLTLHKFSPSWYNWTFGLLVFSDGWLFRKLNPINIKEWSFIVWIAPYLSYRKFEDQFCYPIVWHHDLIKNTEMVLKGVFKAISEPGHGELTEDCIPKALERLKTDSQGGTFLSQEVLKSVPITPYTDETKKRLKQFAEEIDVYRKLEGLAQIPNGTTRISRIVFRYKRGVEDSSRPEHFVTIHESYESSDILKDKHWFLYILDKDYAYFVLLPKEIAHYNIINYPFMFTPLSEQAIKVAEMPLDNFVEWSTEIEGEKKTPNTVLFTNTARCASTLFGSMLQHEGKSVVFAEPHVLKQLSAGQSEGVWNDGELEKLVPASIRAIRKNIPSDQICVIKTHSSDIKLVPYTKLMHDVKHIFMFRQNAVDSVERSTYRFLGKYAYTLIPFYLTLYKFSPSLYNWIFGLLSEGWLFRKLDPQNIKEWAFIYWIAPYLSYRKFEDQFCYPIIWQHELMNNTELILKSVFKVISEPGHGELTEDYIPKALERLKVDSQSGTFLSQEVLKSAPVTPYTDETKKRLKKFAEEIDVSSDITGFDF